MAKKSYSIKFKLDAVDYAEKHNNNQAAIHFKVDPKRIREGKSQKEKLSKT